MEQLENKELLFFHGETYKCFPYRFTIAGYCTPNQITMGIAICSKSDNFVKAEGRRLASARLNEHLNSKGVITILTQVPKGQERKAFNRAASLFQFLCKRELIELFNVGK